MANSSWEPAFCTAGTSSSTPDNDALHAALCAVAATKKWPSRYTYVAEEDELDESVALVYVLDGEVDGLRRRFPHALLVAAPSVTGVDLPIVLGCEVPKAGDDLAAREETPAPPGMALEDPIQPA